MSQSLVNPCSYDKALHQFNCGGVLYYEALMSKENYAELLASTTQQVRVVASHRMASPYLPADSLEACEFGIISHWLAVRRDDGLVAVLSAMDYLGGQFLLGKSLPDVVKIKLTTCSYLALVSK